MILIDKWLQGNRNFKAGCILYNQYGNDTAIKQLLTKGETPAAKEQLLKAMQELVAPAEKQAVEAPDISLNKFPDGNSPVEQAIHEEWKQHLTLMNMLRGKLAVFGEDNSPEAVHECNILCRKILEEEQFIIACWDKLRYYQKNGKLPEQPVAEKFEIPSDPVALAKVIDSIKRNIRRNKQKAAAEPANPLYPALVKKYEQQLQQINDANQR